MKTLSFLLTFFFLTTLLFFNDPTFAQDSPQENLPDGAIARLGKGSLGDIAYSPDGSRLAMGSSLGIWIYDAYTGETLDLLITHTSHRLIVFSPDGTTLASIGRDETIRLWDLATGQQISVFRVRGHPGDMDIIDIAFSPDGRTIACGIFQGAPPEGEVWLWDVATGEEKVVLDYDRDPVNDQVASVAFSPDSRLIACGGSGPQIVIWDADTGEHKHTLYPDPRYGGGYAWDIAFSPDGKILAGSSGFREGTVALWDIVNGDIADEQSRIISTGHTGIVGDIAFSPDSGTIASTSWLDDTVRLWDVTTGEERVTLIGHTGGVSDIAYSPDGSTLASNSYSDNTMRLWNPTTGALLKTHTEYTSGVYSVVYSPNGNTLASGSWDNTVRLWDVVSGNLRNTLTGHTDAARSVAYSPDGNTLASASWDDTVRLWDAHTGTPLNTLTEHTDYVDSVAYSPDGNTLASASWDDTVRLWDATTGTPLNILIGHTDRVHNVAYSPDGNTLASASTDNTVRLWDAITGTPLNTLTEHTDRVYSVAYSPDGNTLASASWDNTVRLWNAITGTPLNILIEHTDRVYSVTYSPDGNTIASGGGSDDTTVYLWDAATGRLLNTLRGHTSDVRSVAFSPDGTTLASGSWDGTVLLWPHTPTPGPVPVADPLDVNGDGQVTVIDLAIVALFYGTQVPVGVSLPADVNTDGVVDLLDLTAVAQGIDAAAGGVNGLSLGNVEAALFAAAEQVADFEAVAEAPMGLVTRQDILFGGIAYRNVAVAFAAAKQLARTGDAQLGNGMETVLKGLLELLAEMGAIPETTTLLPNYPNPFNPETWIPYQLSEDNQVSVSIYDTTGQLIRTLSLGFQSAGFYNSRERAAYWNGRNELGESVASGLYFYTLTAGEFTATRKLLIAK